MDVEFGFGPAARILVERSGGEWIQFRMPLIPVFLAIMARCSLGAFAAYLFKNAIFFALTVHAFRVVWLRSTWAPGSLRIAALLWICTFPHLVLYATALEYEEGYVIHMVNAATVMLLFGPRQRVGPWRSGVQFGVLPAALYLTKASLLPLAIVLAACGALAVRGARARFAILGLLATAVLGWGLATLSHTGEFHIGTSYDGINLLKGNNAFVAEYYPERSLDRAPLEVACAEDTTEWDEDRCARRLALRYIMNHPLSSLRAFAAKAWVVFGEVRRVPFRDGPDTPKRRLLATMTTAYMCVFRLLLVLAVLLTARTLSRPGRACTKAAAGLFWVAIAAYSAPLIVGFAYTRHVAVLIFPVLIFVAFLWPHRDDERATGDGRA
ncbi:MAG TPA: hypothetical protein VMT17_15575 [Anaeromyxobacteraceae bacterium]|nr:hypothetical protein [Anaeromyxobacteraceae bacterium]